MSLDIALYDNDDNCIAEMNWLRNPFGLCKWAEDNCHYVWNSVPVENERLWYVCNNWAYDKSNEVDRIQFKKVVDRYWYTLQTLETTYYFFDLPSYRQFIEGKLDHLPTKMLAFVETLSIEGSKYDNQQRLLIPVDLFKSPIFHLGKVSSEKQKAWMLELVKFAELLQNESNRFYCSN